MAGPSPSGHPPSEEQESAAGPGGGHGLGPLEPCGALRGLGPRVRADGGLPLGLRERLPGETSFDSLRFARA